MSGPLHGVRVIDAAERPAGQFAARMLADLGAEVTRLTTIGQRDGEQLRGEDGAGRTQLAAHAGKTIVAMPDAELSAAFDRLTAAADVVITDVIDPGDPLAAPSVAERAPHAVVCSVTPFGLSGPRAGKPGADPTIQALSGVLFTTGQPGERPYLTPTGYNDTMAASHAAIAIIHALREVGAGGEGQWIDIAMLDVAVAMDCENMPVVLGHGGRYRPEPLGHAGFANTLATFRSPDGYIVMEVWGSGPGSMWGRLATATGRPVLLDDPRFHDDAARLANLDELVGIVEEWLAEFDSDAAAIAALHEAKVTAGQIRTPDLVLEHPQLLDRGLVREIEGGRVIAMPYRFTATPVEVRSSRTADIDEAAARWKANGPAADHITQETPR